MEIPRGKGVSSGDEDPTGRPRHKAVVPRQRRDMSDLTYTWEAWKGSLSSQSGPEGTEVSDRSSPGRSASLPSHELVHGGNEWTYLQGTGSAACILLHPMASTSGDTSRFV